MTLLSVPVLVALGWAIAGLVWWDRRHQVITPAQRPWTMAGMALVGLAMLLAIAAVPAAPLDLVVRIAVLLVACWGLWRLARGNAART